MRAWSISLLFLLIFFSCKIDYTLGMETGEVENYPDIIMREVSQVDVQGDQIILVEADIAEIYNKTGETRFEVVSFKELGKEEEVLRWGNAGEIQQFENENMQMKGQISVNDNTENSSVEAEELFWNESEKTLKSPEDMDVSISLGEDGALSGKGFTADLKTREVQISSAVSGTMKGKGDQ